MAAVSVCFPESHVFVPTMVDTLWLGDSNSNFQPAMAAYQRGRLRTDSWLGMPQSSPCWPQGGASQQMQGDGLAAQLTRAAQRSGQPESCVTYAAYGLSAPAYWVSTGAAVQNTRAPLFTPADWVSTAPGVNAIPDAAPQTPERTVTRGVAQPATPPGVFITGNHRVGTAVAKPPSSIAAAATRTTVMLRNLPAEFRREHLLALLDSQGFKGAYDFVYMPFNFDTLANLGHAFVNMVAPSDVERIWAVLDGFYNWAMPCESKLVLAWNEKQQGLNALVERYRNSPVMHKLVPDECKPIIFNVGVAVAFPTPSEPVKAPKLKRGRGSTRSE